MPLSRLSAPERRPVDLLEAAGANAVEAADLLDEVVHHHPDRGHLAGELLARRQQGDRLAQQISDYLADRFVTPIEREDIQGLTRAVTNAVELIEQVADRLVRFEVGPVVHPLPRLAQVLLAAVRAVAGLLPQLRRRGDMNEGLHALRRLAEEGDRLGREALSAVVELREVPYLAMCWKDLFERVGAAIDAAALAARILAEVSRKDI